MQMMSTFPANESEQVTLANWRTAPFNVWAFHHVREIIPSADIANDPGLVAELPVGKVDLAGISFKDAAGAHWSLSRFLEHTGTDGFAVAHKGRVINELYFHGMTPDTPHILMSVSKSMLGLLAGALSEQGALDLNRAVSDYVPEVARTAYAGATARHLLDMRVGIAFDEDYLTTTGPIIQYRKATNWNPLAPGESASDLRSFLPVLKDGDGPHNGRFHYVSPNTDLLGWVIERAAGRRYADLMSELIWRPMGASRSAYITVDRLGAPRCAGGMCTALMDLTRVGLMLARGGTSNGRSIIPTRWIDDILNAGDADAWSRGVFYDFYKRERMHYRTKWYVVPGERPLMFGMGIHGQNLFVDPKGDLVIAKFSSQAQPLDEQRNDLTMRAVAAIRAELTG